MIPEFPGSFLCDVYIPLTFVNCYLNVTPNPVFSTL